MTADLQQAVINAKAGAELTSQGLPTSPPRKELPNPQQGMADPSASVSANTTGAATSNTACTSPLTVTSLEAAAVATAASNASIRVPQVVSQVVPGLPQPPQSKPAAAPTVESMLDKLSLSHPAQPSAAAVAHRLPVQMEDKKMRIRTPPTEHDNRKLFVGGLPTDVSDHDFLEFFRQFGDVIDSVVIIDRITKRSRGFGFVTFANEKYANSLLTAIPGKTGYVVINGKQCEVKASTPKADDGRPHHHGAPGMWRSNPPRHDHRGYTPRHPINTNGPRGPGPMKHQMMPHQPPRRGKHFSADNEFTGDGDGRNFDDLYQPIPQANAGYQPMYGRAVPTTNLPLYHHNYQNAFPSGASNAYAYPNNSVASDASVTPSWDASYPAAPNQGYVQYGPNAMQVNNGYYDPYAVQQYPNTNSNNSTPPLMLNGESMAYVSYNGYNAEGGAAFPSQGGIEGSETYPQAYPDDGTYDYTNTADQYE